MLGSNKRRIQKATKALKRFFSRGYKAKMARLRLERLQINREMQNIGKKLKQTHNELGELRKLARYALQIEDYEKEEKCMLDFKKTLEEYKILTNKYLKLERLKQQIYWKIKDEQKKRI